MLIEVKLTHAEWCKINGARNEALWRAGRHVSDNADPYPFECAEVAADIMARVVVALRVAQVDAPLPHPVAMDPPIPPAELARLKADNAALDRAEAGVVAAWLDDVPFPAAMPRSRPATVRGPLRPISDRDVSRTGAV